VIGGQDIPDLDPRIRAVSAITHTDGILNHAFSDNDLMPSTLGAIRLPSSWLGRFIALSDDLPTCL
jgi:hypothetical protein